MDLFRSNFNDEKFTPICKKEYSKEVELKNKNWTLSNNRFDVEQDIIGGGLGSSIYLVYGQLAGSYGFNEEGKRFMSAVVRTNLSLTLEKAKNKTLLFASSLDGKEVPNDLKFS